MKTSSLTVLWPRRQAPDISEIQFSFDFCHKSSKQFAESTSMDITWETYSRNPTIGDILSLIHGRLLLFVSDPEVVLSPVAIDELVIGSQAGYAACGPVFNESEAFPLQVAALPMPYVDMDTFVEVSEIVAKRENHRLISADRLHPACILYRLDFLNTLDPKLLLQDASNHAPATLEGQLAVSSGALVHLGFNKGFETERHDLVRLIPEDVRRILDIGCARGGYGKLVGQLRPNIRLTGVELNPEMAEQARSHYHEVLTCPVEAAQFQNRFDLVNCGDILEHLVDP